MTDFPFLLPGAAVGQGARNVISSADMDVLGAYAVLAVNSFASAGAWPTANLAVFIPKPIPKKITIQQMAIIVGAQAGNVDVGIYDEQGNLRVSAGTTAVGAAGAQVFNVADTVLEPGLYYLAMVCSTVTTATFNRIALATATARAFGLRQMASALPLPATAVFATLTASSPPLILAATKAVF